MAFVCVVSWLAKRSLSAIQFCATCETRKNDVGLTFVEKIFFVKDRHQSTKYLSLRERYFVDRKAFVCAASRLDERSCWGSFFVSRSSTAISLRETTKNEQVLTRY